MPSSLSKRRQPMHQLFKLKISHFLLILILQSVGCGERFSPWQSNIPGDKKNLTAENLAKLPELQLRTSSPLTIALIADPQATPDDLREIIDTLNRRDDVSLILLIGDLTDHGLLHEFIWAAEALGRSKVPYFSVIGNHDGIGHGKEIYQKMFGPLNYTFEVAGLKFVMFNNNKLEFGSIDYKWLGQEIDDRSIVVAHIPPEESSLGAEEVDLWTSMQRDAQIIASLHGHRGGKKGFLSDVKGRPYYVVPRARGVRYALAKIYEDRHIAIKECKGECGSF